MFKCFDRTVKFCHRLQIRLDLHNPSDWESLSRTLRLLIVVAFEMHKILLNQICYKKSWLLSFKLDVLPWSKILLCWGLTIPSPCLKLNLLLFHQSSFTEVVLLLQPSPKNLGFYLVSIQKNKSLENFDRNMRCLFSHVIADCRHASYYK